MGTCCEGFDKHWIVFPSMQHIAGASLGETKMWAAVRENGRFFCTCSSNNWDTVQDRWIHAVRALASTELSFHSCNVLRDCRRGVSRANKKWRPGYVKMTIFCNCGSNNWETVVDRQRHTKCAVSSEREGLRTSNLVDGRSLDLRKLPY